MDFSKILEDTNLGDLVLFTRCVGEYTDEDSSKRLVGFISGYKPNKVILSNYETVTNGELRSRGWLSRENSETTYTVNVKLWAEFTILDKCFNNEKTGE